MAPLMSGNGKLKVDWYTITDKSNYTDRIPLPVDFEPNDFPNQLSTIIGWKFMSCLKSTYVFDTSNGPYSLTLTKM